MDGENLRQFTVGRGLRLGWWVSKREMVLVGEDEPETDLMDFRARAMAPKDFWIRRQV